MQHWEIYSLVVLATAVLWGQRLPYMDKRMAC